MKYCLCFFLKISCFHFINFKVKILNTQRNGLNYDIFIHIFHYTLSPPPTVLFYPLSQIHTPTPTHNLDSMYSIYKGRYVSFWAFLISLNIMVFSAIYFSAYVLSSFFYSWKKNPLCTCNQFCFPTLLWMGIKTSSISQLLWIMQKWTWMCKCLCDMLTYVPLVIYPGVL